MWEADIGAVVYGVIANLIFWALALLWRKFGEFRDQSLAYRKLEGAEDILNKGRFIKGIFWLLAFYSLLVFALFYFWPLFGHLSLLVSLALPLCFLLCEFSVFIVNSRSFISRSFNVGVRTIDEQIKNGIDYKKSLKMCKQSIRFLGIGAHKLIVCEAFEEAIRVCSGNSNEPLEFILCHPDAPALNVMEKRNNQATGNYKSKIIESLRKLNELKQVQFNIQVYLYKPNRIEDLPVFRLFFIDSDSVLVSFYVIDSKNEDGRTLPQLQLHSNKSGYEAASFYAAFDKYYSNLRNISEKYTDLGSLIASVERSPCH